MSIKRGWDARQRLGECPWVSTSRRQSYPQRSSCRRGEIRRDIPPRLPILLMFLWICHGHASGRNGEQDGYNTHPDDSTYMISCSIASNTERLDPFACRPFIPRSRALQISAQADPSSTQSDLLAIHRDLFALASGRQIKAKRKPTLIVVRRTLTEPKMALAGVTLAVSFARFKASMAVFKVEGGLSCPICP